MRTIFGALFALALALRLLSPAGFMPSFGHGAVTIVACPDFAAATSMAHQHHRNGQKEHQVCPYAAGAAAGTVADSFLLITSVLFVSTLLLGRTFRFLERHRHRERPPLRGPPVPA
jgi:hypothetical protein